MKEVSIDDVNSDFSGYLSLAEREYVIITRQGQPVGLLIGLSDPEDWWEELLLCHPVFRARIAGARRSLREGKGVSLEALRDRWGE